MASREERIVKRLEGQIAAAQARLAGRDSGTPGWVGFAGGLALGTLAGGLLTLYLTSQEEDEGFAASEAADDTVVLRERATAPRSLAALAPETGETETGEAETGGAATGDPLAAAELEAPEALPEIAEQAGDTAPQAATEEAAPAPAAPEQPAAQGEPATEEKTAATKPAAGGAPAATGGAAASAGRVEAVDGACPESHPVKGNHSSSGDFIYHTPGSRNYDRTKAEACFATEDDAVAAGFRAPRG